MPPAASRVVSASGGCRVGITRLLLAGFLLLVGFPINQLDGVPAQSEHLGGGLERLRSDIRLAARSSPFQGRRHIVRRNEQRLAEEAERALPGPLDGRETPVITARRAR